MWKDSKPRNGSSPTTEVISSTFSRRRLARITTWSVCGGTQRPCRFPSRSFMRTLVLIASSLLSGLAAEIPQGTHLLLRMVNSINTRTAQQGDAVFMETASPIAIDGGILVPIHSYVQGVVYSAKRSGRVAGRAQLGIRIETLTLPGGKSFKIAPHL